MQYERDDLLLNIFMFSPPWVMLWNYIYKGISYVGKNILVDNKNLFSIDHCSQTLCFDTDVYFHSVYSRTFSRWRSGDVEVWGHVTRPVASSVHRCLLSHCHISKSCVIVLEQTWESWTSKSLLCMTVLNLNPWSLEGKALQFAV